MPSRASPCTRSSGRGSLEAVVGHASVFGQERVPHFLRQAVLEEEAVDRAVGDQADLPGESSVDSQELPELGNGAGGPFLDEGENGVCELLVVDPWRGLPDSRCKEGLRAAIPEAGDVVADCPVGDGVAVPELVSELGAFLQGQGFIGE